MVLFKWLKFYIFFLSFFRLSPGAKWLAVVASVEADRGLLMRIVLVFLLRFDESEFRRVKRDSVNLGFEAFNDESRTLVFVSRIGIWGNPETYLGKKGFYTAICC